MRSTGMLHNQALAFVTGHPFDASEIIVDNGGHVLLVVVGDVGKPKGVGELESVLTESFRDIWEIYGQRVIALDPNQVPLAHHNFINREASHLHTQRFQVPWHSSGHHSDHEAVNAVKLTAGIVVAVACQVVDNVVQPVLVDVVVVGLRGRAQDNLLLQRQKRPDHHQQELVQDHVDDRRFSLDFCFHRCYKYD